MSVLFAFTLITKENGEKVKALSFDAFGKPRDGNNWTALFNPVLDFQDSSLTADITKRGFTDHEHLDNFELIHMNGRMYDFNNGRFLSVDPFIQGVDSQAINPYSYIQNNPLSGVDPTGYYRISDNCNVAEQNCSKANVTIKDMVDAQTGETDNVYANRFQMQVAGSNKIGNSLTLADVQGDVSSIGSQVAMNQYGNISFATGIYSFVQFGDGGENLMSLRSTMNRFAADTVNAQVENAKNKVENSKKKAAHVAGFFGSKEFANAGLRTLQTVGGVAEIGADSLACWGTAGLGCGWTAPFVADGLNNIHGAIANDVGFMNQGVRNIVGNDQVADGIYLAGTFYMSYKAFTAPVAVKRAPYGGRTLIGTVRDGKPVFIKPPLRTVPAYRASTGAGLARDAAVASGSVYQYLVDLNKEAN